ncbi:MAG: hypothetical protein AAF593_14835 [Planctomycetota bacterium]
MTAKPVEPIRLAWEDRWNPPTFEQLMKPQKEQHQALLHTLLERLEAYEGVEKSIIWHGSAWKWTLEYTLTTDGGPTSEPMAYFVPDPESPVFCMPFREEMIELLPMKRLNRYIRDGIRGAKCAVQIHWCKWSPTAMTEVEHLTDLIKRKHKILTGQIKPTKKAAG